MSSPPQPTPSRPDPIADWAWNMGKDALAKLNAADATWSAVLVAHPALTQEIEMALMSAYREMPLIASSYPMNDPPTALHMGGNRYEIVCPGVANDKKVARERARQILETAGCDNGPLCPLCGD